MKKLLTFLVLIALIAGAYFNKDKIKNYVEELLNNDESTETQELLLREFPAKEVEIFDLKTDNPTLKFTKSGVASSESIVYLSPEIAGKITNINIKVGDNVKKGETLVELGDSLSTDTADLQLNTAKNSSNLTAKTQDLTNISGQLTNYTTQVGIDSAKQSYLATIQSKNDAIDLYDIQLESAEIGLETSEDAYENAQDAYDDAQDVLDDLEDELDELEETLPSNDRQIIALKKSIEQAENIVDQTDLAEENAERAYEQAKLGIDQLETTYYTQINQLNTGIKQTYNQYLLALSQNESSKVGSELQNLGAAGQVLQANLSKNSAALNQEAQNIKSPINGIITQIQAKEDNMTSPGQVLLKIESTGDLTVKTSINLQETKLINLKDKVKIIADNKNYEGEIVSISPTPNEITKKFDVEIDVKTSQNLTVGAFVKIQFITTPANQIFIPLNGILITNSKKLAKTVLEDNTVLLKEIKTGQIIGDYIEVIEGLDGNEKIISSITSLIEDGEKVITTNK